MLNLSATFYRGLLLFFIGLASKQKMPCSTKSETESAGARIRFGFDLGADGKMLVPNSAEQRVLEFMHRLWNAGSSFRAIARELQGRGIAAKEGAVWTHITVAKILRRIA